MKDLFHVCMTAHKEVMTRNFDDARDFTNLMALAAFRNDTSILADSVMSNHVHFIILSESPQKFALSLRYSLTKHFNHIYGRTGRLFDKRVFIRKLEGTKHIQMAINYCLRNGLHHGQSETAFAYPFSTCNYIFSRARGILNPNLSYNRAEIQSSLPKNSYFPDYFAIDNQGVISRDTFQEIRLAESWYGTPTNYIYNMNRRTTEDWIKEQEKDDVASDPITLKIIEKGVQFDSESDMLKNEMGGRASVVNMNDLEVCSVVDNDILGRYKTKSIYQLNDKRRCQIALELINDCHINAIQAARCVAIPISILPDEYRPRKFRAY